MPTTTTAQAMRPRAACAVCASRNRGLCQGVDDRDVEGSSALDASHAAARVYDAADQIYGQGDDGEYVFVLTSGWVALHRDLADGRRHITQIVLPGALFGVGPPHQTLGHGATALTAASTCPIARTKLDDLRRRIPSLNERFIQLLQRENDHALETLTTLAQGSAKERIARLLSELADAATGETPIGDGAVIKMPLTQRQIAEATGITAIHVNRVLKQLREDRIVDFRGGVLVVTDPRKLSALTDSAWGQERVRGEAGDAAFHPMRYGLATGAAGPHARTH